MSLSVSLHKCYTSQLQHIEISFKSSFDNLGPRNYFIRPTDKN